MSAGAEPDTQAAAWMGRALQLAERGRYSSFPNPRVGCVVVRRGRIVGEGWHVRAGEAHAEVHALDAAGEQARGAEVFVTLEPCAHHGRTPPCVDALIDAGVARVWAAMRDPDPRVAGRGIQRLRAAGIEVRVGLLESAAQQLNRGFVSRLTRGRPWVTLKLASSLDGRTAMANGESQWITGADARADVHRLRAEAGAVLTGAGTVIADDPSLNVRQFDARPRVPDRIVLDSHARVPATARVWNADGARCFHLCGPRPASVAVEGVQRIGLPLDADGRVDLPSALNALAKHEINQVLVECGPTLAGALLAARRVDELVLYMAPRLLGEAARGLAALPGIEHLAQALSIEFTHIRRIGRDLRITAVPIQE